LTTSFTTAAPRSAALKLLKLPPNLPAIVRTALTITASRFPINLPGRYFSGNSSLQDDFIADNLNLLDL
jgi:hypothetical protein